MHLTNIDIIRTNFNIKNNYPIISNISYTYQYIEYLSLKIKYEHNNLVITKLLIKDYIVNSISIIEALFYLIIKSYKPKPLKYRINFSKLLKIIIEDNHLKLSNEDITLLYKLKYLRNKIHIYSSYKSNLTDYNSYTKKDYLLMKTILYKILNNNYISNGKFKEL